MQFDSAQFEHRFKRLKASIHGLIEDGLDLWKEIELAKIEALTAQAQTTRQQTSIANVTTITDATNKTMTAAEVAEAFGFKRPTVYEWRRKKGLPCHRFNGKLRFYRHEVLAWTERHKDLIEREAKS